MALSFITPKNKDIWLRITEIGRLTIGEEIKPLPNTLSDIDHCWEYDTDDIVFWWDRKINIRSEWNSQLNKSANGSSFYTGADYYYSTGYYGCVYY